MIGPLKAARERGATSGSCRSRELADAVRATTTLVVCSHVGWVPASSRPPELAEVGVPVILDGAQGAGAVPVDMARARLRRLRGGRPEVAVRRRRHGHALRGAGVPRAGARGRPQLHLLRGRHARARVAATRRRPPLRHAVALARGRRAVARPRCEVLERHGLDAVLARAATLAAALAEELAEAGHTSPRAATARSSPGRTPTPRPRATASRDAGVVVRNLPGTPAAARLGRRLERRVRPRAPARRAHARRARLARERAAERAAGLDRQVITCLLSRRGRRLQGPGRPHAPGDPRRADRARRADAVRALLAAGHEARPRLDPPGDLAAPRGARGGRPGPTRRRAATSSTTCRHARSSASRTAGSSPAGRRTP